MPTPACFQNSSPEIVPVTINQTIIQLGDSEAGFKDEYFSVAAGNVTLTLAGYNTITLGYLPADVQSLILVLNSGVQLRDVNFTINGKVIVLDHGLSATDKVHVHYFTAGEDGVVSSSLSAQPTGTLFPYDSTGSAPSGYLWMDGVTPYSRSLFSALWLLLKTGGGLHGYLLTVCDGDGTIHDSGNEADVLNTHFVLVDTKTPIVVNGGLVQIRNVIKT